MPQKPSSHSRTWGTRFDTLPTSPPVSPEALEATAQDVAVRDAPDFPSDITLRKKEEKMPHDASVFVGSLPSHIDQPELTRMLSEHLSEHTEVKNIKVVRDSKGGVCAFVQCEDASSAAALIHTLHSTVPRPFLGRLLRYEPARAFRTLLISYRTPMQFLPPGNVDIQSNAHQGESKKLDLPLAMRLWRPRNSKFFSLLYNAEAVEAENQVAAASPQVGHFSGDVVHLQPVTFDAETIQKLAAYFGPLECFGVYQASDIKTIGNAHGDSAEPWKLYPHPHDAVRSPGMDESCWEVKWEHRDDCVSALMTLRRVPHLTVTWAHQPTSFGLEQPSPYQGHPTPTMTTYPVHVQDRVSSGRIRSGSLTTSLSSNLSHSRRISAGDINTMAIRPNNLAPRPREEPGFPVSSLQTDDTEKRKVRPVPHIHGLDSSETIEAKIDWTETDFPPLGDVKEGRKTEWGVWGEKKVSGVDKGRADWSASPCPSPPPDATKESALLEKPVPFHQDGGQELDMPPTPGLGMSPITPKTSDSVFPATPTSATSDIHRLFYKGYEPKERLSSYADMTRVQKELDPTTLFVGGLEMYGPAAWDEEKVGNYFSRFGGLEQVKVVRPVNSRAAFAFVKFNNTESPARAVSETHNRLYEGRIMRVQLRDCNPSRGSWKRGGLRGRFQQPQLGAHRRFSDSVDKAFEIGAPANEQHRDASVADSETLTFASISDGDRGDAPRESEVHPRVEGTPLKEKLAEDLRAPEPPKFAPSSEPPELSSAQPSQSEGYREWYDEPTAPALTSTPPSLSSSASLSGVVAAPTLPYSMSNGSYYPSPPWMLSYPQQVPYHMPYFGGYPGYPMPGQQMPIFTSPSGSDASGPAGGAQNSWPTVGMYGSYIPYQMHPSRAPTVDQGQQTNSQAPLAPTGFIQNEQGTLIAVYQPEALDQYMSGAQVGPPSLPQHQVPSTSTWSQFPVSQPLSYTPTPQTIGLPTRSFPVQTPPGMGWVPNPVSLGYVPSLQTPQASQTPSMQNPTHGFRGGFSETNGPPHAAPLRRQAGRRDQQGTINAGRNSNQARFGNHHTRGNPSAPAYRTRENVQQSFARPPQFTPNPSSAEWNQWASSR